VSIDTKELNITIECGADFLMTFVVRDSADALVDLTGAEVTAQIREYAEAVDYYQMTAVHNGAGGKVTLGIAYEDTERISFSRGVYDVFIDFPNDTREKYLQGSVTVIPSVTKPVDGQIMYLLSFSSEGSFPVMGLVNRVYFSHASGKMYRWNGTGYVGIVRDGDAATVEVGTVETLPAGSDATVENVGSLTNAVINFGIPKGDKGDPGVTEWDDIQNKPETFPPEDHDHDDRYYTEEEVDTMLGMKADAADLGDLAEKDMADWDTDIDNIPEAFPPEAHNHDDRYYTELETDALLADKVDDDDLGSMAYEDDAPTDGKQYARKDGDWEEVTEPVWGQITGTLSDQTDLQDALDSKADIIVNSASGAIVSIPDAKAAPVVGLTVGIEPVQSGSGDPSPDNVRPISGWTEAKITKTGKNLFPTALPDNAIKALESGGVLVSAVNTMFFGIPCKPNTDYYYSADEKGAIASIYLGDKAPALGDAVVKINAMANLKERAFNTGTHTWVLIQIVNASSFDKIAANHAMLEVGSAKTSYEPTIPSTEVTIDLDGTVYGGTVDVLTGTLTVTDAQIASYAGETLPSTWISDRDVYAEGTTPTTGAQVVYKLADPVTVQLTSATLSMLYGNNTLWADTGDISVDYKADTKLYIEALKAQLQALILQN
jgi:hypothetical protein